MVTYKIIMGRSTRGTLIRRSYYTICAAAPYSINVRQTTTTTAAIMGIFREGYRSPHSHKKITMCSSALLLLDQ